MGTQREIYDAGLDEIRARQGEVENPDVNATQQRERLNRILNSLAIYSAMESAS